MSKNNIELPNENFIEEILNPRAICIFGANNNPLTTMGSMQFRNIIAGHGFEGSLYPIHPRLEKVQGFKAYKSVFDIPIVPDLAFIILPTHIVPKVMEECGQKGIKHLIITSGGFREIGNEGKELSKQIDAIANKYKMRFIGPNCLGIYNGWYGFPDKKDIYFNTFWPYLPPERGNISIVSQSGTIAAQIFWHAKNMGVKIGKSISVGNERNIDIVDLLKYFIRDPQTGVIGLYIEEIKRGKEFIKLTKKISPIKPIVAIYGGGTQAADRSIKSHTGSLGGNNKIFNGVFKETGIFSTDSIMDFLYYLRTFSQAQLHNIFPLGKRLGIITDSGGSGSLMAKTAEHYGLNVPKFSQDLQTKFKELLPSTASVLNPVDVTFDVNFMNLFYYFPKLLMNSNEVDMIIIYGVFDFDEIMDTIEDSGLEIDEKMRNISKIVDRGIFKPITRLMKMYSIPVYYVGPFPYKYSWYQRFISHNIPIFDFFDYPTKCLSILSQYAEYRKKFNLKIND
ncbi:MAG: CoA-binding protein [Candidatus Thorarchaeota archaeon]